MMERELLKKKLPPLPPLFPTPSTSSKNDERTKRRNREYTALPWTDFFDEKRQITVEGGSFNVYMKGKQGPVFLLLHGGGYSGLTWAVLAEELLKRVDCRLVAPDLRGHGDTITSDDADLSADRQVQDILNVYSVLFDTHPPTFVIGHSFSMGGALAVRVCSRGVIGQLLAVAVIDVVEGSAMEALQGMTTFLRGRPAQFPSVEAAVQWCLKTGTVRNMRAARISMPAQVKPSSSGGTGGHQMNDLSEEPEDGQTAAAVVSRDTPVEWRIDLLQSEPYWTGWFNGLSALFLSIPAPKLLILAGVDRLDKDLTVGQMQGKFQMIVLPKVGHAVHEDSPDRLADAITTFCVRNKFCEAIGDYHPVYPGC